MKGDRVGATRGARGTSSTVEGKNIVVSKKVILAETKYCSSKGEKQW